MIALIALALAQGAVPATTPPPQATPQESGEAAPRAASAPPSIEEARLRVCLDEARNDPPTAIVTASGWLDEARAAGAAGLAGTSLPQQCLGFAYTSLLRWEAAEQAFIAARDALPEGERAARARLGTMAGNAALAGGRHGPAATLLETAQADAEAAGANDLAGEIAADRARALVGADRAGEAGAVLEGAQVLNPQSPDVWLLSATLARRGGDLNAARAAIATAYGLARDNAEIALEAGLIAALSGNAEAACEAWNGVAVRDPQSPHAEMARSYLAQLGAEADADAGGRATSGEGLETVPPSGEAGR